MGIRHRQAVLGDATQNSIRYGQSENVLAVSFPAQ